MSSPSSLEQAITQHRAGALQEAEPLYIAALAADPDDLRARAFWARLLVDQGRFAEALTESDRVLAADPRSAEALMQKGFALRGLDRLADAAAHYDVILSLNPNFPPALYLRGDALFALKRPDEALQSFDRALTLHPNFPEAWLSRGAALNQMHRPQEAIASFDRALAIAPDYPEAWYNRGLALEDMAQPEMALASYDRAIALRPDHANAHNNRALTLMGLRRFNEAAASYEQALALDPSQSFAFGGLATAALHACDWDKMEALRSQLETHVREAKSVISPGAMLGYSDDPDLLQRCMVQFTRRIIPVTPQPLWRGETFRNPRIRIAYLSTDFHEHATAYWVAELFERHDRASFEIWGVGFDADDGSAVRQRLIAAFDHFVDARQMSDRQVAEMLHAARIDITVDLKGHTLGARPAIFAQRPAPLQINYIGFVSTMGTDYYDYILGDAFVTPVAHQPWYNEAIVQLPDCYMPIDSRRVLNAPVPTRAQAGLPEDGFVFCCFNNNWKITAPLFAVWMHLLAQVPGSVLWLLEDNGEAVANLRWQVAAHGIAAERVIFASRVAVEQHLARHALADLFLDTLPYNAHTTASDSLRAGVPLVTLTGRSFAGRVATSVLHAVGLPDLAADSLERYEAIALNLARHPAQLAALRQRLKANLPVTPLFDGARYCRAIEAAYRTMWQRWQDGEAPASFTVPRQS